METAGLVTSYWEDSDIGGRRHYYNISPTGLEKLSKAKFEWPENKQFMEDLFKEADNKLKEEAKEALTQTAQHMNDIKKEKQLEEKQLEESLEAKKPVIAVDAQPVSAEKGFVLPTVSPLQQDLFSLADQKEAIETLEKAQETTKEETPEITLKKIIEIEENIEEQVVEPTKEAAEAPNNAIKEDEKLKTEKYASTPSTYVQVPMFEGQPTVALSGITAETTQEETVKTSKEDIKHIRKLATETDFKNLTKNLTRNSSFLNKEDDYKPSFNYKTDTDFEKSDTLYGRYEVKEEFATSPNESPSIGNQKGYNNLGIDEDEKEPVKEENLINYNEEVKPQVVEFKKPNKVKPVEKKQVETDNINYKEILGELFTDSENGETLASSGSRLRRIDVSKNVNVTLNRNMASKKPSPNDEYKAPSEPVYKYTPVGQEVYVDNSVQESEPEILEPLQEDDYSPPIFSSYDKPRINNLNNNMLDDTYSNSVLEDTYLEGIKLRVHKKESRAPLFATSYVSINRVKMAESTVLFLFMFIQILAVYIALSNSALLKNIDNYIFMSALAVSILPTVTSAFGYLFNPNKKEEIHYNLGSKLTNNFIVMLIIFVVIYALNMMLGMNSPKLYMDYIVTWLLPAVLSTNLLLIPVVKYVLLKRKNYYL